MSINVMIFAGNVGGDMEIRHTPAGKSIGAFNVAVNQGWGDNKKTNWVTCKMFNERAEKLGPYIKKGMLLTVSGELSIDEWEKDGVKNKRVCCIVNDVQLPKNETSASQPPQNSAPQQQAQQEGFDEDIPF
jgi:single-strand DNA-binding protein